MVWHILLAHFLADYPLQFSWILRNKRRTLFVAIHAGVHLVMTLLLVGAERGRLWPYLAVLAGLHFIIDVAKNVIYKLRPKWVVVPYIVDQCIHYLTIWILAARIQAALGDIAPPFDPQWAILGTSYLLAMYVWYISERIMVYASPTYQAEVQAQYLPRMLTRGALLTLLLTATSVPRTTALAASAIAILPYVGKHRWRALLTDIGVVCAIWIFFRLATG
ncbi:MAG TPA: DUF3307 domain-containing protein [Anaerolineales bacterium]|nr:DUF3307 domain-containing protein [Anaerolineales bacterium]